MIDVLLAPVAFAGAVLASLVIGVVGLLIIDALSGDYPHTLRGDMDRVADSWGAVWLPLSSVAIKPLAEWLTRRLS